MAPLGYYRWDQNIGGWARGDDGEQIVFPYDTTMTAFIAILHIAVVISIPMFFIKSFVKNRKIKLANWKRHGNAIIFVGKKA